MKHFEHDLFKELYSIEDLQQEALKKDVVPVRFSDVLSLLFPSELAPADDFISDSELYKDISNLFHQNNLESFPPISKGFMKHSMNSLIFVYSSNFTESKDSELFKQAAMLVRAAVIMMVIDGESSEPEVQKIRNIIWSLNYLSLDEKKFLFAKSNFLISNTIEADVQMDKLLSYSLRRDLFLDKFYELSNEMAKEILSVVFDVAIADEYLDPAEHMFIKDMYRVLDIDARKAKKDIEDYAKSKFIILKTYSEKNHIPTTNNEIDDFEAIDFLEGVLDGF